MKQIIQDMKSGQTMLEEVPSPQVKSGSVLIKTSRSLVSLGTERMLVEFGKANLIEATLSPTFNSVTPFPIATTVPTLQ